MAAVYCLQAIRLKQLVCFRAIPIDYNLYHKFWQLQDYFRRPAQCYEKVAWKTFASVSDKIHVTLIAVVGNRHKYIRFHCQSENR